MQGWGVSRISYTSPWNLRHRKVMPRCIDPLHHVAALLQAWRLGSVSTLELGHNTEEGSVFPSRTISPMTACQIRKREGRILACPTYPLKFSAFGLQYLSAHHRANFWGIAIFFLAIMILHEQRRILSTESKDDNAESEGSDYQRHELPMADGG